MDYCTLSFVPYSKKKTVRRLDLIVSSGEWLEEVQSECLALSEETN
jgi:hypothetical protein